jgi:hypothetical protein
MKHYVVIVRFQPFCSDHLVTYQGGYRFCQGCAWALLGMLWLHPLKLVSGRPADEDSPHARFVDGAGRGESEDSDEFPCYEKMMDAVGDPSHLGHNERSAWVAEISDGCALLPLPPWTSRREPGAG